VRCDIFIKGCRSQLHWLSYCLQFLQKNWREDSRLIVQVDEDCRDVVSSWRIKNAVYHFTQPWPDPYMHALYCKMLADQLTDADLIILLDSDTMLFRACGLSDVLVDGKPIIQYRSWDTNRDPELAVAKRIWPPVVKKSTGLELELDYMIAFPCLFWRSTFSGARGLIEKHLGKDFKSAVYSEHPYDHHDYEHHPFTFVDLETLYLYGEKFESDKYHMSDYAQNPRPEFFKNLWSWTPFEQVQPELNRRLYDQSLSPVFPF
jgi:hypothetical protein